MKKESGSEEEQAYDEFEQIDDMFTSQTIQEYRNDDENQFLPSIFYSSVNVIPALTMHGNYLREV